MSATSLPPQLRAYLSTPALAQVWAAARTRLERNGLQLTGALTLDLDDVAAERLSGLLGRPVEPGTGRRVKLAELDSALRRSAAGQGLITVLELLDGRPLIDRAAARQDAHAQWTQVWQDLDGALAASGLAGSAWVPEWIAGLRRTGVLTRAGTEAAARALDHAVATLRILLGATAAPPASWELAALASRVTGNAHGLDDNSLASAVLLRAAAHGLGMPSPESAAERRDLWQALGVATDSVSGTVIAWQLRPPGTDRWSRMVRDRAELGLVTHLSLHELDRAGPIAFAAPAQVVSVCENPQVLQAAAHAGVPMPLLCLSGNPATVGTRLLRALIAAGNPVRYHGDFDWPGVAIAGRIIALGAAPWLMFAADYRKAVNGLDPDHAVALTGTEVATPWDPALTAAMSAHGLAVHEESVLADLLRDLETRRHDA
ncbi:MAG: TIGR02679 family protein [Catenulispora sp. 13_1_20CM_3_70_7]|nr:MAG: TIGR02679 family protein [Catenulispora sp. 13_1_20CM_3_70_7]